MNDKKSPKTKSLPVTFVGLEGNEKAPEFAVYELCDNGRPVKKIAKYDGEKIKLPLGSKRVIALGPDVEDMASLPTNALHKYRVADFANSWASRGLVLPRTVWPGLYPHFHCVSGTVEKCRPWWFLPNLGLSAKNHLLPELSAPLVKPLHADDLTHIHFPITCQPICDGIVEIYERECCCDNIFIPDLLDRLRDILDLLPIPIPDPEPWPDPWPDPWPGPRPEPIPVPLPGPGPLPLTGRVELKAAHRKVESLKGTFEYKSAPPERLYKDYMALRVMPEKEAQAYVGLRPYLLPVFCHCNQRKVGETVIQPDGRFSFCHMHFFPHVTPPWRHCSRSYAYVVKQMIDGVMTVVNDGLGANEYFSENENAEIQTFNPMARPCPDGSGTPPPNDGDDFVMLEHIGKHGTFHFNTPLQTGVSTVAAPSGNLGTYTVGSTQDCPWGGQLNLRLWISPGLKSVVEYYRFKVVAVNSAGNPVGDEIILNDPVSWSKFVNQSGSIKRVGEFLGPVNVGTQSNLFKVPYWSAPDHQYLSGQSHQKWVTSRAPFPDGKYMLITEVFDGAGNLLKPSSAAGSQSGTSANFQYRIWDQNNTDTRNVPFADLANVFWVDNTPVTGDITKFGKDGVFSDEECQFKSGPGGTNFAIQFKAYHVHGVTTGGGLNDDNSFMKRYYISWQRGLNGPTGSLGPASPPGNNYTDAGEGTVSGVSSGSQTFASMLNGIDWNDDGTRKCTFSVHLFVDAKHYNGIHHIDTYDYRETASFALEETGGPVTP